MTEKKSKPRGRPALPPTEKKRRNFTFRGNDEMHDQLTKAATASGRSISEEIEWRLGQSFFTRDVVRWAVDDATQKIFAYVDEQRAKDESDRPRSRPFSDLFNAKETDK